MMVEAHNINGEARMADEAPPGIDVEERSDGVVIYVPPAGLRGPGCFLFIFALVWCGLLLPMTGVAIAEAVQGPADKWLPVAFLVFLFWPVGIGVLLMAVHLSRQETYLTVAGAQLSVEQNSPVRNWRRCWPHAALASVRVGWTKDDESSTSTPELQIRLRDGTKVSLLSARDEKKLAWLAKRLRKALNVATQPEAEAYFQEREKPPTDTQVRREDAADGVTLTVPPAGIMRGSKGLFVFSVVWLAFIGICDVALLLIMRDEHRINGWGALCFSLIFWLIGIGMLLGAIQMGRRQAVLAVVGDQLAVLQTGPLRTKRYTWTRTELADVRTGPSGMTVNGNAVLELEIYPRQGTKTGLLAGRDPAELAWLATVLRRSLRLPAAPGAADPT